MAESQKITLLGPQRTPLGILRVKTVPTELSYYLLSFFMWRFDPIPGHGPTLRGFASKLRHTTLGRIPLWTSD